MTPEQVTAMNACIDRVNTLTEMLVVVLCVSLVGIFVMGLHFADLCRRVKDLEARR